MVRVVNVFTVHRASSASRANAASLSSCVTIVCTGPSASSTIGSHVRACSRSTLCCIAGIAFVFKNLERGGCPRIDQESRKMYQPGCLSLASERDEALRQALDRYTQNITERTEAQARYKARTARKVRIWVTLSTVLLSALVTAV